MKNYQVFNVLEGLSLLSDFKDFKFNYAVLKNSKLLEEETNVIKELLKKVITDDMQKVVDKVETKRSELKGESVISIDEFLDKEEAKLYTEYTAIFESIMNEDSKVELYKIGMEDIPRELDMKQSSVVMEFIK